MNMAEIELSRIALQKATNVTSRRLRNTSSTTMTRRAKAQERRPNVAGPARRQA